MGYSVAQGSVRFVEVHVLTGEQVEARPPKVGEEFRVSAKMRNEGSITIYYLPTLCDTSLCHLRCILCESRNKPTAMPRGFDSDTAQAKGGNSSLGSRIWNRIRRNPRRFHFSNSHVHLSLERGYESRDPPAIYRECRIFSSRTNRRLHYSWFSARSHCSWDCAIIRHSLVQRKDEAQPQVSRDPAKVDMLKTAVICLGN